MFHDYLPSSKVCVGLVKKQIILDAAWWLSVKFPSHSSKYKSHSFCIRFSPHFSLKRWRSLIIVISVLNWNFNVTIQGNMYVDGQYCTINLLTFYLGTTWKNNKQQNSKYNSKYQLYILMQLPKLMNWRSSKLETIWCPVLELQSFMLLPCLELCNLVPRPFDSIPAQLGMRLVINVVHLHSLIPGPFPPPDFHHLCSRPAIKNWRWDGLRTRLAFAFADVHSELRNYSFQAVPST